MCSGCVKESVETIDAERRREVLAIERERESKEEEKRKEREENEGEKREKKERDKKFNVEAIVFVFFLLTRIKLSRILDTFVRTFLIHHLSIYKITLNIVFP